MKIQKRQGPKTQKGKYFIIMIGGTLIQEFETVSLKKIQPKGYLFWLNARSN
jgi:hypothetical protein